MDAPLDQPEAWGEGVCARFGLSPGARIVVGASGGVDSTVLLRLVHEAGFAVAVAHVNYGLRGAESDGDEAFVRAIAEELAVPFLATRVEMGGGSNKQARAREARYRFFGEVAETTGAEVVAVGSTRDDQAETVLLHLFRGTGLRGLAGMPAERPVLRGSAIRLIRPLLDVSRREIAALANARGWAWREDASNAETRYRRNAIRHRVLPIAKQLYGEDVAARIARTAERVRAFLDMEAGGPAALFARLAAEREGGGTLPLDALRRLPPAVRRSVYAEAFARWAPEAPRHAEVLEALDGLLDAQPGRRVEWEGGAAWRSRAHLTFRSGERASEDALPAAWDGRCEVVFETPDGTLTVTPLGPIDPELVADPSVTGPNDEVVDADVLMDPLALRPWQAGDRFQPLGLDGTKRVSDLLTERLVPPEDRARQRVLCAGQEGRIVWVVGHRLAEGARLRVDTREVVRLAWRPVEREGGGA
ncbi:MAG TPA: tRNA lysidine(34) synthetase TilS [Rubricoccaceae bacterium]|nr:tRNA lysidine(34) synthetase TilS [Rubricoccaceae bacterium]